MNGDEQFWLACWKLVVIGGTCIALSVGGCVANTHYQVTQAIKSGADPLAAACAHALDGTGNACLVVAATSRK